MSTLGINVVGTNLGTSIDVDKMMDRLTAMRDRLSTDYVNGGKSNDQLATRIQSINHQIDRLNKFSGKDVNISQAKASEMLRAGMDQLQDGMDYLTSQGEANTASTNHLNNWYNGLTRMLGHVDVQA